ncbi:hypothetical protein KUTeg_006009 [Tegillarca granosa]|uniref:Tyrosine-protein phosphatase domain-containing protein n=1 Tax=Tegillarca granosa TaxID=220873 RepID=A0ABQ9FFB8_TEGGR|nr:hypothetical protein KUTeg_006009 [Tegillarca granosa]
MYFLLKLLSVTKLYGYIATHYPLQNTVCDFWCMIYDQESEVIVALNGQGIDEANEERVSKNSVVIDFFFSFPSCIIVLISFYHFYDYLMLYEEVNIFTTISQLQIRRPEFIKSYIFNYIQ